MTRLLEKFAAFRRSTITAAWFQDLAMQSTDFFDIRLTFVRILGGCAQRVIGARRMPGHGLPSPPFPLNAFSRNLRAEASLRVRNLHDPGSCFFAKCGRR